jgi:hypothetical protein
MKQYGGLIKTEVMDRQRIEIQSFFFRENISFMGLPPWFLCKVNVKKKG